MTLRLFLIALALGALPARLSADDDRERTELEQARAAYQKGRLQFNLGHYRESLQLFETAYERRPVAAALFNIAQCHRLLGEFKEAAATYKAFIANDPRNPVVPTARAKIAEVEEALRLQGSAQTSPPLNLAAPTPPSPVAAPAVVPIAYSPPPGPQALAGNEDDVFRPYDRAKATWGHVLALGALGATGSGVYFGIQNRSATADWRAATDPLAWSSGRDRAHSTATVATISWVAAGLLTVGAVFAWRVDL